MKVLALGSVLFPALAALTLWFWPEAARPHVPVPPLIIEADRAEIRADLVPPQLDLTQLPMLVTGRAARGARDMLLQEWPGLQAEARFHGEAVSVRFADNVNRWRILIDGGQTGRIELSRPDVSDLRIRGLSPGEHHIRVEKISESSMPASFGGILISSDSARRPAPSPRSKLIEFIGDSDTTGFASTASRRDCTEAEVFATTDTSRSFAAKTAAALGSDYRVIARSGIGLVRNHEGMAPLETMPSLYPLALPGDPQADRITDRKADVVVTALGANDFGSALTEAEPWQDHAALSRDFETALIRFLRERVRENPDAMQVLLAFGEFGDALVAPYREAEAALRSDGVHVALVVLPELRRNACRWHPSARDHELISQLLVEAISGQKG